MSNCLGAGKPQLNLKSSISRGTLDIENKKFKWASVMADTSTLFNHDVKRQGGQKTNSCWTARRLVAKKPPQVPEPFSHATDRKKMADKYTFKKTRHLQPPADNNEDNNHSNNSA
ncbi:unnamed protein product [Polarella glacialis]|uniref:Uncharacterized protein n=1 Tax=Polarella glacialis TaxID=89957 RepID=A0A813E4B5_POLGL|nr:unnamed protein product [Polarella glacialis]CAE8743259.1 unnamed protein product [Polarella glacialis]